MSKDELAQGTVAAFVAASIDSLNRARQIARKVGAAKLERDIEHLVAQIACLTPQIDDL
jgi:hypothetical protein